MGTTWKAWPHTGIQKLTENLWRIESEMERPPIRRAMDVVRAPDGGLWIHNAIALEESAMKELEAWGTPSVVLVPNGYHRIDPGRYKERYPNVKVYAPKGSAKRVGEVVQVDGTYDDLPKVEGITVEAIDGVGEKEAAIRVTSKDGESLLVCDAVFNMQHKQGFMGWMMKTLGSSGGPRVSKIFRLAVLKDKAPFKKSLERLAEIPNLKRVLVQHEDVMTADQLRAVAASV